MFLYPHDTTIQRRLPVPFLFTSRTCAIHLEKKKKEIYELRFCEQTHREKTHGEKNVNKQARALAIFNSRNPISIALGEVREKENFAAVDKIKFIFSQDILEISANIFWVLPVFLSLTPDLHSQCPINMSERKVTTNKHG